MLVRSIVGDTVRNIVIICCVVCREHSSILIGRPQLPQESPSHGPLITHLFSPFSFSLARREVSAHGKGVAREGQTVDLNSESYDGGVDDSKPAARVLILLTLRFRLRRIHASVFESSKLLS